MYVRDRPSGIDVFEEFEPNLITVKSDVLDSFLKENEDKVPIQ